ncbi:hypothetical protein [Escherichia coli]|uniref:hypothetical protein n=1 Tax=Escherichia coli TaxID=562 RepID=UPI000BDF14BF|nr:hypothetical protein [Escherichia coli]EFE7111293.1 hypothetical protein [Escherichia coli]EFN5771860.1 hypothetical protein [Escherichia coli]EJN7568690.1 hypothetical protein [Escherichia coli]EKG1433386.1 hypothetical protein [Escherichia coli]MBB7809677.1 hypothetical protein [Escherichia coli]
MKQMTLIEMDGFLKGKCIPRDLKVNETNAEYLVRKFAEAEAKISALSEDHQKAIESIKQADAAVKLAHEKFSALAAENAGLKAAFDKPQAYLSWHAIPPTWEDPLPCGEYLDVHDDAGHKNSDGTDCWPVYAKPEIETPSTDAFLAEVRAQGVEMYADNLDNVADDAERGGFDYAVKFLRSEASSVRLFADQLRKGGKQ